MNKAVGDQGGGQLRVGPWRVSVDFAAMAPKRAVGASGRRRRATKHDSGDENYQPESCSESDSSGSAGTRRNLRHLIDQPQHESHDEPHGEPIDSQGELDEEPLEELYQESELKTEGVSEEEGQKVPERGSDEEEQGILEPGLEEEPLEKHQEESLEHSEKQPQEQFQEQFQEEVQEETEGGTEGEPKMDPKLEDEEDDDIYAPAETINDPPAEQENGQDKDQDQDEAMDEDGEDEDEDEDSDDSVYAIIVRFSLTSNFTRTLKSSRS